MESLPRLSAAGASLLDRRGFLGHAATAAGGMALLDLLAGDGLAGDGPAADSSPITPLIDPSAPYAPRLPHFPAKAKRLIVIFCAGAVSQLETWDWKPELVKYDDKPLPGGPAVTFQGPAGNLARPQYDFKPRGQTGKMVSEMIPHLAGLTDDIAFNLYDTVLAVDHAAGTCRLLATGFPEREAGARAARAAARLDLFGDLLGQGGAEAPAEPVPALTWRSNFTRAGYEAAVERVRAYIRAGDIYQANIAQRFSADLPEGFDGFSLYRRLRATNPATFGAYLAFEGLTVASSSPERFLKLDGRDVETRPIKGTARRVADPEADRALGSALQANPSGPRTS